VLQRSSPQGVEVRRLRFGFIKSPAATTASITAQIFSGDYLPIDGDRRWAASAGVSSEHLWVVVEHRDRASELARTGDNLVRMIKHITAMNPLVGSLPAVFVHLPRANESATIGGETDVDKPGLLSPPATSAADFSIAKSARPMDATVRAVCSAVTSVAPAETLDSPDRNPTNGPQSGLCPNLRRKLGCARELCVQTRSVELGFRRRVHSNFLGLRASTISDPPGSGNERDRVRAPRNCKMGFGGGGLLVQNGNPSRGTRSGLCTRTPERTQHDKAAQSIALSYRKHETSLVEIPRSKAKGRLDPGGTGGSRIVMTYHFLLGLTRHPPIAS